MFKNYEDKLNVLGSSWYFSFILFRYIVIFFIRPYEHDLITTTTDTFVSPMY